MNETNQARVTVVTHTVGAIFAGFLSVPIAQMSRSLFAIGAGILILIIVGFITEKISGKKGFKFWIANGIFVYMFFWLVTWVYLINV